MMRVAIIDDEEAIRAGLSRMVADLEVGAEVVGTAADGLSGLELLGREKPDVAIVDIRMPAFSGLDLIERASKAVPGIRFIILSAHADFEYARRALRAGVIDYLQKPCNRFELRRALLPADAVDGRNSGAESIGAAAGGAPTAADLIRRYLDENFYRDISLSELADHFRLSPAYLSTLFKKSTGKGVIDYLHELRVEKARELLRDPTLKVAEAAQSVGFHDVRHFSRVFKRVTGRLPTERSDTES